MAAGEDASDAKARKVKEARAKMVDFGSQEQSRCAFEERITKEVLAQCTFVPALTDQGRRAQSRIGDVVEQLRISQKKELEEKEKFKRRCVAAAEQKAVNPPWKSAELNPDIAEKERVQRTSRMVLDTRCRPRPFRRDAAKVTHIPGASKHIEDRRATHESQLLHEARVAPRAHLRHSVKAAVVPGSPRLSYLSSAQSSPQEDRRSSVGTPQLKTRSFGVWGSSSPKHKDSENEISSPVPVSAMNFDFADPTSRMGFSTPRITSNALSATPPLK